MSKQRLVPLVLAGMVFGTAAYADKLSPQELAGPQSLTTWQTLSDKDKEDTITDYLTKVKIMNNNSTMVTKMHECVDKEAVDPDYKDLPVSVMIPFSYCMVKYSAILSIQKPIKAVAKPAQPAQPAQSNEGNQSQQDNAQ